MKNIASRWLILGPFAAALAACSFEAEATRVDPIQAEAPVSQQRAAITPACTATDIASAIAAGGDILLDCGATATTLDMTLPTIAITQPTRVRALRSGLISFRHRNRLFQVSNTDFTLEGVNLRGEASAMALFAQGSNVTWNAIDLSGYSFISINAQTNTTLTITNSNFHDNSGIGFTPVLYGEGANLIVRNSTFKNNATTGKGGAITTFHGSVVVENCTFISNSAANGGAISINGSGTHRIVNSTFAANRATQSSSAIGATSTTTLQNCTFGHNIGNTLLSGNLTVQNSILLDNSPGACSLPGSNNLQWPSTAVPCGNGFRFANPALLALADNGGPTYTFALDTNSKAIDATSSNCPQRDQRGVLRPRDGNGDGVARCDIGAFER